MRNSIVALFLLGEGLVEVYAMRRIAGCVAADVVESFSFGYVFGVLGDDEAEFALVVGLVVLCDFWDDNGRTMVV